MNGAIRQIVLLCSALLIVCSITACRNIYTSTKLKADAKDAFIQGKMQESLLKLEDKANSWMHEPDRVMWSLDAASVAFEAGEYERALNHFQVAQDQINQYDQRAVISVRNIANEAQNLFTNPLAIPYNASTYDRILIKTYMALCYFGLGKPSAARVEIQGLRQLQDDLDAKFSQDLNTPPPMPYSSANNKLVFNDALNSKELKSIYNSKITYRPYGNVMNPLASYLSAMNYYLEGNTTEAALDLRRLNNMVDTHPIIQEDYNIILDRASGKTLAPSLFGQMVYVIYANGVAPSLQEEKVELVLPYVGYTGFAYATCKMNKTKEIPQLYFIADKQKYASYPLADFEKLFTTEYNQQLPLRITRVVASTLGKEAVSGILVAIAQGSGDDGIVALTYILTGLYKYIFNTGDTRSWEMLPAQVQVARFPRPSNGVITIKGNGYNEVITLPKNSHSQLIYIRTINQKQIQLKSWILKQKGSIQ